MTILRRNTPPRRFSVRFCPYCGHNKLKMTKIQYHSNKEHRFCENCCVYFEVQEDWFNDLPGNNEPPIENSMGEIDNPYDCSFVFTSKGK